jgi:hypothetical protein
MNQLQIIHHIRNYVTTGIIDDTLIEFYDQHGRWQGDTIKWNWDVPRKLLDRMKKSHLPSSRRTCLERSGTVLRTSYIRRGNESVRIDYCGIRGSLVVNGNAVIHAACLRDIGGNMISSTTKRANFPNLRSVGGNIYIMRTFDLATPRLRHVGGRAHMLGYMPPLLETVGGSLEAYWCFDINATRLRHVGGCLVLTKPETIRFPLLETIGGSFLPTQHAKTIEAPKLKSIGGDFIAASVVCIRTPALRSVGGNLDTSSARGYYDPRVKVGGEWTTFPGDIRAWELRERARQAIRGGEHIYL